MKLKNSTAFPDYFLRRMVSWCCRQLDMPVRMVRECQFRNRTTNRFSGHAYHWNGTGRIVVSVAPDCMFPWTDNGKSIKGIVRSYADRIECLVGITAHELRHVAAEIDRERTRGARRHVGSCERYTERDAQTVLAAFREQREQLLAAWNTEPARQTKPKPTRKERNAANAQKKLAEWQRKLKLAQTKVKQYKQKVRYYERTMAATTESQN